MRKVTSEFVNDLWQESGYECLAWEDIPVQITTVCDIFDVVGNKHEHEMLEYVLE